MADYRPVLVPLPKAPSVYGPSRSRIYRLAAEKRIKLVKMGRSTFVEDASMRAYLAGLPTLTPKNAA